MSEGHYPPNIMPSALTRSRLVFCPLLLLIALVPWNKLRADISGFGAAGAGFSLNSGVTVNAGAAKLTDGGINEARSIFYGARQPIGGGFNVSFIYQESASVAAGGGGFAFVVQNDSRGAQAVGQSGTMLGYGGGGIGAAAVSPSAAVELNLLNVAGVTAATTGYATNGALTLNPVNLMAAVNPGGGHAIRINLAYDGSHLTETFTDTTTGAISPPYTFEAGNLAAQLGTGSAYIGFTGSTGLLAATQTISDFSFVAVPETSLWGVMVGGGLLLLSAVKLRRRDAA